MNPKILQCKCPHVLRTNASEDTTTFCNVRKIGCSYLQSSASESLSINQSAGADNHNNCRTLNLCVNRTLARIILGQRSRNLRILIAMEAPIPNAHRRKTENLTLQARRLRSNLCAFHRTLHSLQYPNHPVSRSRAPNNWHRFGHTMQRQPSSSKTW